MTWSPKQDRALLEVKHWLNGASVKNGGTQVFRLFGYAGTGKTTLAKEMAAMASGPVCYGAFTGKAASVMRRKGCVGASTIHSLIYELKNVHQGEPEFALNLESAVKYAKLVIIDECSMVDPVLGNDLLSFGTKILVIGDPAQLPPVGGAGFFTSDTPDVLLTEVHRQALENPIIQLSMQVREGKPLIHGAYGGTRILSKKDVTIGDVMESETLIVGLNRTREQYNKHVRHIQKLPTDIPVPGDKLICLKNDHDKGVLNGTMWRVTSIADSKNEKAFRIGIASMDEEHVTHKQVAVLKDFFNGTAQKLDWRDKKHTNEFTFGYAITCHKSQGSQWNDVLVFDESQYFKEDAGRWLYTAITRAAEKLTLVMN